MARRSKDTTNRRSIGELERLQWDLRQYSRNPKWDMKFREELSHPIREAERKVRAKILSIPSQGLSARRGRESLRRKMSRALKSDVGTTRQYTGAFVWMDSYSMPTGEENIPAYMERVRRYGRWRHQVYGMENVWTTQKAHPYFYRTLRPYETVAADVTEKVIDQVKREIET